VSLTFPFGRRLRLQPFDRVRWFKQQGRRRCGGTTPGLCSNEISRATGAMTMKARLVTLAVFLFLLLGGSSQCVFHSGDDDEKPQQQQQKAP
jgi:hypothetical protein